MLLGNDYNWSVYKEYFYRVCKTSGRFKESLWILYLMFSLIYILDVFFCLFWKIKIIIIKPYRASYFSSKLWEVLKSLKKKTFILFYSIIWFNSWTWPHCERVAAYTKHNSILSHSIPLIPSHPTPFHSTLFLLFFSILFYSILFYSCLVYSLIGKNHYCPTKHLKVTKNSYAD